ARALDGGCRPAPAAAHLHAGGHQNGLRWPWSDRGRELSMPGQCRGRSSGWSDPRGTPWWRRVTPWSGFLRGADGPTGRGHLAGFVEQATIGAGEREVLIGSHPAPFELFLVGGGLHDV